MTLGVATARGWDILGGIVAHLIGHVSHVVNRGILQTAAPPASRAVPHLGPRHCLSRLRFLRPRCQPLTVSFVD
ncbi:MAG: hypothetical protein AAGM46_25315 [Cyanobacteria bacterium J06582_2]